LHQILDFRSIYGEIMPIPAKLTEQLPVRNSLLSIAIAVALFSAAPSQAMPVTVRGVVAGSYFTPPVNSGTPATSTASTTVASVYAGAKVCFDLNNNGACDPTEPNTVSKSDGSFTLTAAAAGNLVAEISTNATNGGNPVTQRTVFRIGAAQVAASAASPLMPANVAITPLSTEALRMMENEGQSYANAKEALAERLGVDPSDIFASPSTVGDSVQRTAILTESVVLTGRFTLAAKMVDRGDVSTKALAANPNATGPAIQIPEAEQVSMNIEGIPRYDHIFIIVMENKGTNSIVNSPYAPNINAYLQAGNQFTNYYATGNPSEPNYTALGGGDDFGITNDDQWNCDATGVNAPKDLPLPTNTQPGLAKSPFAATCTDSPAVNHNITGPNMMNAMTTAGMTWRTYNESTNPGQDFRTDSVTDSAVTAPDNVYPVGTLAGNTAVIGDPNGLVTVPNGLYKTKHNPAMAFQNARSAVEFKSSNRTMGGSQWDAAWSKSTVYAIPANFDKDQFGTDLATGDVGALNYVVPDQCDDMHSVGVSGTDTVTGSSISASDCGGVTGGNAPAPNDSHDNIIARGDKYVKYMITKIQASPLWQNQNKRVAIVVMFDEGSATSGFNSCCGWNPGNSTVDVPLKQNADGTFSPDTSVANYFNGNRGHGNSIFAVLNNQPNAPKQIKDSDAYSHFSFVRTLQDMFGLADPKVDGSYMNRSKYTESFITANILNLPQYASASDTHFDGVRPMNHAYVIPANYVEKQSNDESVINAGSGNAAGAVAPQVGPDANQVNVWALK
jgi:hypothetical protein